MNVTLDLRSGARTLGGSNYQAFTETLLDEVLATLPTRNPADTAKRVAATALGAFRVSDEVEAMLAGQAVAMHHMALECVRPAMLPDQHPDIASKLLKDGANLCRGMTDMLDALDRKRGKGPLVVRVKHAVVHEGGQAIVGTVHPAAAPKVGGWGVSPELPKNLARRVPAWRVTLPLARLMPAAARRPAPVAAGQQPAMPNGRCRMHGGAPAPSPRPPRGWSAYGWPERHTGAARRR
jgi:hypothetical protein